MAEYRVTAENTRCFRLTNGAHAVGELIYAKWFTFDATLTLTDQPAFQIKPRGFWGTTIELQQHGSTLLHFTMGWNGDILLHATFPEHPHQTFIFRQKGVFKSHYVLTDDQGLELLAVQHDFRWKNVTFDFSLITTDAFEAHPLKDVLLLLAVHCANYYLTLLTATTFMAAT